MFFVGTGAHINVHAKVEAARAFQFIPNEKRDLAWRFAMDQNLRRGIDLGESDRGIGEGDALKTLGGIDKQRLANHHAQGR